MPAVACDAGQTSMNPGRLCDIVARSAPTVRLVPMPDAERDAALERESVGYADAKARAGIWTRDESLERARAEIRGYVGEDPAARGHEFFVGQDDSGRRVGWIWLGPVPMPEAPPSTRWLFNIVVEEKLRGRGFGRALLRATEAHVAATGRTELAFNVFRWNAVALALYTSAGYRITYQDDRALEMRKRLLPA